MLLVLSGSPSAASQQSEMYNPCNAYFSSEKQKMVLCENQPAEDILNAFLWNKPNRYIQSLIITNPVDMTDDLMEQILSLVSKGSDSTTVEIDLSNTQLNRVPESIKNFKQLETLLFVSVPTLQVLTTRSVVISSTVGRINFSGSNIHSIEPNAFKGD